jgi:sugar/nucleoside kinase (ribokinase family)
MTHQGPCWWVVRYSGPALYRLQRAKIKGYQFAMRYLIIGHVCKDLKPDGWVFGGTATYASRTARAIGCDVQVITSTGADVDVRQALPDMDVINSPAEQTTTFENVYIDGERRQTLHATANRLTIGHARALGVSQDLHEIDVVHLAPVAQEVDFNWLDKFAGGFIGLTLQGWLRGWNDAGHVGAIEWPEAEAVLRRATAVVLSIEDVNGDEALVKQWAEWARVLVVTRGRDGCSVHFDRVITDLPTLRVPEVDVTGAGDVFAAAFFVRLKQTASPTVAARFANCMATKSITRPGLQGVPTADEIQQCLSTSPLAEAKYPLTAPTSRQ